jgi:predicted nucleic acid-binding protein
MKYLLDTNVLSEWWKPQPAPSVVKFIEAENWFVPAPVIAEIQEGAEVTASDVRKIQINARLDAFIRDFEGLVMVWDSACSRTWGRLRHTGEVKRQPQALWDSLIEAMAVQNNCIIASRNEKDFRHAKVFNPFTS